MKIKLSLLISLVFFFFACKKETKTLLPQPYSVTGKLTKSLEGQNVKLIAYTDGKASLIDSIIAKNQSFTLSSGVKKMKLMYLLIEGVKDSLPIILSENPLLITIQNNNFNQVDFGTNVVQKQYSNFISKFSELDSVKQKKYKYVAHFIAGNADSDLATIVVNTLKNDSTISFKQFKSLFNSLDSVQQNSDLGSITSDYITTKNNLLAKLKYTADSIAFISRTKSPVSIRRPLAPIFAGESSNGSDFSLRSLIGSKKVIIIDFWASWCGPCRVSNPTLVRLYKKYKNRGLGIISVSEDKSRNAWINAIAKDHLTWPQIIDDSQRIAFMYNVSSIPHVIVLDSRGGFLRRKTSSHRLEADIIKLLKE